MRANFPRRVTPFPLGRCRTGDDRRLSRSPEAIILRALLRCPSDPLVQLDGCDNREVRYLQENNASAAELCVRREEEPQRTEDDEGQQVERRVEVGESIASRCLQDVDAVHVEVLLSRMRNDPREAVGQHTR